MSDSKAGAAFAAALRAASASFHPCSPKYKSVANRSVMGAALALPAYAADTPATKAGSEDRTRAPPTGTMKFLSVLCTMASTRPVRMAWFSWCVILDACSP